MTTVNQNQRRTTLCTSTRPLLTTVAVRLLRELELMALRDLEVDVEVEELSMDETESCV